ncbi:hypothetical protein DC20_13625 [Rufibacter tibetensis]|uniref:N-acetyltransferase domain-containing protein n=1 Tax=Rufibacter tibetensis TaxID=512763 RepID=A0A0P0D2W3_9BACT|nr:hypothetical protein DC20_13625 [Rufibacter tibetensis]
MVETATPEFSQAWQLYEEAFPPEEQRSFAQQQSLLANAAYQFFIIRHQEEFAGLLGVWQLPESTFLEHFAVVTTLRGKGIGAGALQLLVKEKRQPIVLEVEPPLTEIAKRRISFYERLGFHLNDFEYRQPPYAAAKPWVKLQLMTYPEKVVTPDLEMIKAQLYKQVYGQAV